MTAHKMRDLAAEERQQKICVGDCCVGAVRRSYTEMCSAGQPETAAFETALAVFKWHHPEVGADSARTLVRGWVVEPNSNLH